MNQRLADWIALLLSLLAVILSYWVSEHYFEGLAHLEDEQAYVWQAQALAGGKLRVGHLADLLPGTADFWCDCRLAGKRIDTDLAVFPG